MNDTPLYKVGIMVTSIARAKYVPGVAIVDVKIGPRKIWVKFSSQKHILLVYARTKN